MNNVFWILYFVALSCSIVSQYLGQEGIAIYLALLGIIFLLLLIINQLDTIIKIFK